MAETKDGLYKVRIPPVTLAAYYLRNAAQQQFDDLVARIEDHTKNLSRDLLYAPTDEILKAQGRLQAVNFLLDLLRNYEAAKPKPEPTPR